MTTLTFILVIGVIWSVTSKRKREDILGGFWETDQHWCVAGKPRLQWATTCPQRGLTAATMT